MKELMKHQIENITTNNWTLNYNVETDKAVFLDRLGNQMDSSTLDVAIEGLKKHAYDLFDDKYRKRYTTPLDELSKHRNGIKEYNLIVDDNRTSRNILEVYGDENELFTIDQFTVFENRRISNDYSPFHLNYNEAKELLDTLQKFVDRVKDKYES